MYICMYVRGVLDVSGGLVEGFIEVFLGRVVLFFVFSTEADRAVRGAITFRCVYSYLLLAV